MNTTLSVTALGASQTLLSNVVEPINNEQAVIKQFSPHLQLWAKCT